MVTDRSSFYFSIICFYLHVSGSVPSLVPCVALRA